MSGRINEDVPSDEEQSAANVLPHILYSNFSQEKFFMEIYKDSVLRIGNKNLAL